jgi:hypothetical protein
MTIITITDPDQQPLKFHTLEEEMICEYLYIINHSTFFILVPWHDESTPVLFAYLLASVFRQKFHNLLLNNAIKNTVCVILLHNTSFSNGNNNEVLQTYQISNSVVHSNNTRNSVGYCINITQIHKHAYAPAHNRC